GSTFHLAFAAVDDAITERSSGPTPRLRLEDLSADPPATILVVEDEEAIRQVASRVLSTRGYTVLAAGSGEEALQMADGQQIDLLLTDMVMPGIGGPELAQQLRATRPELAVLFTSGYSRDAIAHEFGLDDAGFIAKPYGLAQLVSAVRERLV
ncbi:MAG TPA: response regulator, partial [Gemmatimonadaceae bacterium]|nr:response regulator [Gemmatimonadaceae bacterium]